MEYLVWCIALSEISPLFEDIKHCMDIPNVYFIVISLSPRDGLLVRSIDTARITLSEISRERVLWYLSKYLEDYWEFVFNRDIAMLISPFWYWYIIPLNVWFLERDIKLISNESLEREREYCGISLEIYQYHLRFLVKILQSPRTGYLVSDIASEISLAIIIPWIFRERYLYHQLSQEK